MLVDSFLRISFPLGAEITFVSHVLLPTSADSQHFVLCFFQDKLLLPTTALLLSITLRLSVCTHQPAPRGSHSCYGRWPASRAESRCSSTTLECPHSGRSYSWPGPHTHLHLQNNRVYSHLRAFCFQWLHGCTWDTFTHLLLLSSHTSAC